MSLGILEQAGAVISDDVQVAPLATPGVLTGPTEASESTPTKVFLRNSSRKASAAAFGGGICSALDAVDVDDFFAKEAKGQPESN